MNKYKNINRLIEEIDSRIESGNIEFNKYIVSAKVALKSLKGLLCQK